MRELRGRTQKRKRRHANAGGETKLDKNTASLARPYLGANYNDCRRGSSGPLNDKHVLNNALLRWPAKAPNKARSLRSKTSGCRSGDGAKFAQVDGMWNRESHR